MPGQSSSATAARGPAEWGARRLDRTSPVPFYYQLQEVLKQELEVGRWGPGDLMPSESELEATFGVSRTVIRKALDVLEGDGQVYRVKGKGTVVAPPKFRYEAVAAASRWPGFAREAPVLWRLIHVSAVPAGAHLGRVLLVPPGERVWEIVFVSAVGDVPVSLSQMYLRRDASPALAELASADGLPEVVEHAPDVLDQLVGRYAVDVHESAVTVESTRANEFEADQLGIGGDVPVFLLGVRSARADGFPIAFTRAVVRSDHFHFSVVIRHDPAAADRGGGPSISTSTVREP